MKPLAALLCILAIGIAFIAGAAWRALEKPERQTVHVIASETRGYEVECR